MRVSTLISLILLSLTAGCSVGSPGPPPPPIPTPTLEPIPQPFHAPTTFVEGPIYLTLGNYIPNYTGRVCPLIRPSRSLSVYPLLHLINVIPTL